MSQNEDFSADATDEDITVLAPAEMTLLEAMDFGLATAIEEKMQDCYIVKAGILEIIVGDDEFAALKQSSGAERIKLNKAILFSDLASKTGYCLPRPDSDLEKAYPCSRPAIDALCNMPVGQINAENIMPLAIAANKDYADYLFDTFQKVAAAKDTTLLGVCWQRICDGVINSIPVSRTCLTSDRRHMLVSVLEQNGMLKPGVAEAILKVGTGPSSWEIIDWNYDMEQAKNAGTLVDPKQKFAM